MDVDVGQNSISLPGCIAAAPIDRPIDLEVWRRVRACVRVCVRVHVFVRVRVHVRVCACACVRVPHYLLAEWLLSLPAAGVFLRPSQPRRKP